MDFQTLHRYNRLVKRGQAIALTCPRDNFEYITRMDKDDEPILYCPNCLSGIRPGLRMQRDIEKTVRKFE